jgi:hypothetical protein
MEMEKFYNILNYLDKVIKIDMGYKLKGRIEDLFQADQVAVMAQKELHRHQETWHVGHLKTELKTYRKKIERLVRGMLDDSGSRLVFVDKKMYIRH